MSYIRRAITPVLQKRIGESKCLLITGARQVGKSTLVRHIFPSYHRANFDDRLTRMQAKEEPGLFFLNNPAPLFIDEVQKESSILEEVKIRVDDSDQRGMFILSGSQNLELMKGAGESLAGRVSVNELSGLSLREILEVPFNRHFVPTDEYLTEREKYLEHCDDLWNIIHRGAFPELYDVDRDWQDYYSSYVATYLERDINELITTDSITFTKFLTAVAARSGELLNYSNIASEIGVSEPTVKTWISILERTGIVYILQPFSSSALNRALRTPKIYFRDTGLACYLTRWLTADRTLKLVLKNSQFMVMRCEHRFSTDLFAVSVFGNRTGDRKSVIGACAASYLIVNYKAPARCIVKNIGDFGHFKHKSALTGGKVIGRAYSCEKLVYNAYPRFSCRNE